MKFGWVTQVPPATYGTLKCEMRIEKTRVEISALDNYNRRRMAPLSHIESKSDVVRIDAGHWEGSQGSSVTTLKRRYRSVTKIPEDLTISVSLRVPIGGHVVGVSAETEHHCHMTRYLLPNGAPRSEHFAQVSDAACGLRLQIPVSVETLQRIVN